MNPYLQSNLQFLFPSGANYRIVISYYYKTRHSLCNNEMTAVSPFSLDLQTLNEHTDFH